jgi:hypothetical protein
MLSQFGSCVVLAEVSARLIASPPSVNRDFPLSAIAAFYRFASGSAKGFLVLGK